jgi:hypothetical protein
MRRQGRASTIVAMTLLTPARLALITLLAGLGVLALL